MLNRLTILSKIGGRSENQDFYGIAETPFGDLIIVCDGMGGHKGGRHAAKLAVEIIIDEVIKNNFDNPTTSLKAAIEKANVTIWDESNSLNHYNGMGTTVVALLLTLDCAICCHVGDSRLYQLRDERILYRTFDHSLVFELVKNELLTEEEARLSEKSNIITRALGISPTVDVEIKEDLESEEGDRFLLCTDGIWGPIPESQLVEMVSQKSDIEMVLTHLVEEIDSIGSAKGGRHDNLTAALIQIDSNSAFQIKNQKKEKKG